MTADMVGKPCFDSALFANLFQDIITCAITRNRKDMIVPTVPPVFLNDSFGYFQQTDA